MPSFNDFPLQSTTRAVLTNMEITEPTPIQIEAIPALLAGKDLLGQSATGSGKTLAYSIPIIERLARNSRAVQALVLLPTRELAVQVGAVLGKFASSKKLSTALLVGGRPYNSQISALRYGAQIVVGTPGRVQDHLERGTLVLNQLRICVLDEADQMLDIGFAPIIEEILATTPETRQMALFSATMPEWIAKLQQKYLTDPVKISIPAATGAESTIEQIAYQVPHDQKMAALCTLLYSTEGGSSLIFGKTKFGVEKLGKQLTNLGFMVGTLHGDKSQRAREEVLTAFRHGRVQTLLATNVAARGLDIQGIYQVINYELPESSELFTHRIGRTGRMGRQGKAITLLVPSDVPKWRRMSGRLGQAVALQKLAINQEAIIPRPLPTPAPLVIQEPEQNNTALRLARNRKRVPSGMEYDRRDAEQNNAVPGRGRVPSGIAYDRRDAEQNNAAPGRRRVPSGIAYDRRDAEQHNAAPGRKRVPSGIAYDRHDAEQNNAAPGRRRVPSDMEYERQDAEQNNAAPRPARNRKRVTYGMKERPARPEYERDAPDDFKRSTKEGVISRTAVYTPEDIATLERSYVGSEEESRRGTGRPGSSVSSAGKRKAGSFAVAAPQQRTGRKKPGASSSTPRGATTAKRSARR